MRKRLAEIIVLALFLAVFIVNVNNICYAEENECQEKNIQDTEIVYVSLNHQDYLEEQEEIRNEIMYGEIELLAQLVEAEAGNQDEAGKRYVADVVLNRMQSKDFPDTVEQVIYQDKQFEVANNGMLDEAGWYISDESFRVALEEYTGERLNTDILYFRTDRYGIGTPAFKYGDHYFSTK